MSGESHASHAHRRHHIILGVTGSVATIKAVEIAEMLADFAEVKVVATQSSLGFLDASALDRKGLTVLRDEDEWRTWRKKGDPVVHIDLRKWADLMIVAPLSANTLAKMSNGLCDNLLTSIIRAWDFAKPLVVAPAMNTQMWDNPFTRRHLETLESLGVAVVPPVSKALACGDVGQGALADPLEIARACRAALHDA
uniref:phosphopantothenoylcysteine decarboxylase n=2 Tax=Tetraselmis sp. GSL018 TaxID=582737 RepID=A0A061R429_9CHLO|mmetsp:Transcript_560/g.1243  ORF Transcript_560/g.1243 Transcript_560/m.1243 type:complete len:196 (-) Transcript_560:225-812(-)